jgi:hypothetical protein
MSESKKSNPSLKDYNILEAFLQVNYLDGFDYVDKAGSIVNSFVRELKSVPEHRMQPDGMVIIDPTEKIKEIKVSPNTIWLHFVEPKNLGDIYSESQRVINFILEIIKPTIFDRVGWRTYFIEERISEQNNPLLNIKRSSKLTDYDLKNIVVAKEVNGFATRLEVYPVSNVNDPKRTAVLFDIDLSKLGKALKPIDELGRIKDTLKSEDMLGAFKNGVKNVRA